MPTAPICTGVRLAAVGIADGLGASMAHYMGDLRGGTIAPCGRNGLRFY